MTRQRMMNILGAMTAQEKELFALMDCLPREESELEENILLMRILQTREYDCVDEWLELLKKNVDAQSEFNFTGLCISNPYR